MADPFGKWYSERHGHEPGREAVEALAEEWLEGMLPGTEHSVSPHRSEYFRELIGDWLDDPVTDAVQALLPEWVRWNGEQAGVPAPLIECAVSAASDGQRVTEVRFPVSAAAGGEACRLRGPNCCQHRAVDNSSNVHSSLQSAIAAVLRRAHVRP
jgi:hypothetical protein